MTVELLTEHCLEFLSLTGGCTGSSECTLVKMSNCWKSCAAAQMAASTLECWNSWFEILQTSSYRRALCISLVLVLDPVKI